MDFNVSSHFGLGDDPFRNVLGGSILESKEVKKGKRLFAAIRKGGGIGAVIGDWGSGKTSIVQAVLEDWRDDDRVTVVRPINLDMDRVTNRAIAVEIIREIADEREAVPQSSTGVGHILRERLGNYRVAGRKVLLILEEAHDLRYQVLRGMKTMTEMSWAGICPLLGVLLVGHRKLATHLERWPEVGERCLTLTMRGLSRKEVSDDLAMKIKSAGGDPKIVEPSAVTALQKITGQPLFINGLMAQAMERAYRDGHAKVTEGDIMGTNGEGRFKNLQILAATAARMGIEQGKVGESIGITKGTTSNLVHGKYVTGNSAELTMQLTKAFNEFIEAEREKAA